MEISKDPGCRALHILGPIILIHLKGEYFIKRKPFCYLIMVNVVNDHIPPEEWNGGLTDWQVCHCGCLFVIAKLSPSSSPSWTELVLLSVLYQPPATHPPGICSSMT
jgi:hypothetical protein